jgi:hypothetical protein
VGEDGTAAAADVDGVGAATHGHQLEIDGLSAVALGVLRTLAGTGPSQIEVSPGVAADVNLDVALKATRPLRALRNALQDYLERTQLAHAPDESTIRAAVALRDLLEIVLGTPLLLAGEAERTEPAGASRLDAALKEGAAAADALDQAAGWGDTEPEDSDRAWVVTNLTPNPVELRDGNNAVWLLPAHGRRSTDRDPRLEFDLRGLEGRGEIDVCKEPEPPPVDYSPLALWVFLVPIAAVVGRTEGVWGSIVGGAIAFVLPLVWFLVATVRRRDVWRAFVADLPTRALQALTFLLVLTFCLAVPAATLYYGANLDEVVSDSLDGSATTTEYLTLVCRTMQLVLISVASMLPALLYYQFDRDRLSTLRERFEHQIFRLDRRMKTLRDIDAKYGRQIDEIYGRERSRRSGRLPPGRRAPIFVATVLIMLGWLLVLLNPDVGAIAGEDEIAELFHPRQTAPAFAFLGAYFFTLLALLRGYVRRDLRPKSYSDISVRIVTVVILAWVLELMLADDSTGLLVFAFVIGIVPQALLNRLRELSQSGMSWFQLKVAKPAAATVGANGGGNGPDSAVAAALADPLPLTDLQGIDLYDRTRLASEGVTNIEALAHHDLVELMLMTRIPVPRLVDWTDQAILHLHVGDEDRATLRRYGIRTASDLIRAYSSAMDHKSSTSKNEFLAILGGDADKPKRLDVIVEAMRDEAWMESIRFWHGDVDKPTSATKSSR